ncbi:hypothetical protein CTRI78_v009605 [Colletotrichum trifolii]|uniref:Uncharacterized protein n=1 Tax=Colletotrichum trifolii TaxID=5466 RepID=A0A4R8QXM3_COLTR|nr:hypothetical protein CTRI78_v009605 [Colletotrichum trifolii]
MKHISALLTLVSAASVAHADPCTAYRARHVMDVEGAIGWRFYHDNPDHWSWNAQKGDAVIQDDGWAYFDGDGRHSTATIKVVYNDGTQGLYQAPSGREGWCTLPAGGQMEIQNVFSWD